MLIHDAHGHQLLEVIPIDEGELLQLEPLTHAVVVARRGGKALLVFNRFKAHWELPGGRIDSGETPRNCAVRELREESGLRCEAGALRLAGAIKMLLRPGPGHADGHVEYGGLYVVDIERIDPFEPNDEISDIQWWDGSQVLESLSAIDKTLAQAV